ncbi:MAG: 3-deoxy-manno-octulosonate cytidylyltransferase [Bacteroidota bacterium]
MQHYSNKKIVILIPARYKSTRCPGKPLVKILGIPMVVRVAQIAERCLSKENVFIATDDKTIAQTAKEYGFQYLMTSDTALTGTDRLYEAALQVEADIYINIQGDEPAIEPIDVQKVVEAKIANPEYVVCGMTEIKSDEDPENRNLPKVAFNQHKELIYMSRLAIPGTKKNKPRPKTFYKQVCIYGFSFDQLKAFYEFGKKGEIEFFEDIEILRFFELGIPIKMVETFSPSLAVDEPADVAKVEAFLKSSKIAS